MEEVTWTDHATMRWKQRFPYFDKKREWESARPITRAEKAYICIRNARARDPDNDAAYLLSPSGVVFVVSSDGAVVTCFPYRGFTDVISKPKDRNVKRKSWRKRKNW